MYNGDLWTPQTTSPYGMGFAGYARSLPGLYDYWRFNESSGTTAFDDTNRLDLTYFGAPVLQSAPVVSNTTDKSVNISNVNTGMERTIPAGYTAFDGNNPWTLVTWVNISILDVVFRRIFNIIDSLATSGFTMYYQNAPVLAITRTVAGVPDNTFPAVTAGKHMYTAIYSGSGINVYDGITNMGGMGSLTAMPALSGGIISVANDNAHAAGFGGNVDDTLIYNRALTLPEITNLYALGI
jgi:hypothetical protein